jgi:tetratricopeptide (TPR) repeat protein
MMRNVTAAILALSALALTAPRASAAACQFQKIVEVPVTMEDLRAHVSAKINGKDATLTVDTGASFSNVSEEAAARYGMKPTAAPMGLVIHGVGGGQRDARAVQAQDFSFAGAQFHNIEFLLGGRVGEPGVAGVLGENLMGPFDVEYDLANGVIRFFRATDCHDQNLAYWSAAMALSKISLLDAPGTFLQQVKTRAQIDGHTILVTLDSGSPLSVISRVAAARDGVKVTSEGVSAAGATYGIFGKGQEMFLAPFASFKIGDEEIRNTQLRMADIQLGDSDMLLGADFFLSHRILISNSQKKLYFTYNGGPVFRLGSGGQKQVQGAAVAQAAPVNGGAEGPKTGADFARRASASAARGDYQAAIADYGHAIALEPDNARHYRARAMARWSARQPVLALADFDEALKREPNDADTLLRRGEIYLQTRDAKRARLDFEAALKLSPDNPDLPSQIGLSYARAGLFEPALAQLDTWIAAHPKDESLPQALSARCWTRAAWGKELEKALADCDLALRRDKTSEVMTNRALVLLRTGRLDDAVAQYTAALKLQPRSAPALYGRGLAELKKGAKAEGEADIAAASAIAPGLPQQYKRYGLTADEASAPAAAAKF